MLWLTNWTCTLLPSSSNWLSSCFKLSNSAACWLSRRCELSFSSFVFIRSITNLFFLKAWLLRLAPKSAISFFIWELAAAKSKIWLPVSFIFPWEDLIEWFTCSYSFCFSPRVVSFSFIVPSRLSHSLWKFSKFFCAPLMRFWASWSWPSKSRMRDLSSRILSSSIWIRWILFLIKLSIFISWSRKSEISFSNCWILSVLSAILLCTSWIFAS